MHKNKSTQLLFGIVLSLFSACNSSTNSNVKDEDAITFNNFFNETDNAKLFLKARFSECGEWGGHDEKIVVYSKADSGFYLNYKKFKVNCDSIGSYYGTPSFQKLKLERTLKLNPDNKISISDYIQRMVKSKIEERFPGHAGNSFSVFKSDSTLIIKVYDYKNYDVVSYNKLLTELNLVETTDSDK